MSRLKIGILGTRGIPNQYGGFEQFAEILSASLAQRGHEVYVYCSSLHLYQQPQWNGVHLIHCKDPENRMGTVGQFLYDRSCLKDAQKRNFDILLHLGYTSDSVWHRLWPKKSVNIVNMDGLEWKRSKYNSITRRFLRHAERLAAKHADVLVADSIPIREYLLEKYNKSARFIAYCTTVFEMPDTNFIKAFPLRPSQYFLAIARMEPENNFEMIINGWLASGSQLPLVITGNTNNRYGRMLTKKYQQAGIIFTGPIYDRAILDNLRHHSLLYFHGHSVGGTNPSLLEAMGCGCSIAAHYNTFNKAILGTDAAYFLNSTDITNIILLQQPESLLLNRRMANQEKVKTIYTAEAITDAYEALMYESLAVKNKA